MCHVCQLTPRLTTGVSTQTWRTRTRITSEGSDTPSALRTDRNAVTWGELSAIQLLEWQGMFYAAAMQSIISLDIWAYGDSDTID